MRKDYLNPALEILSLALFLVSIAFAILLTLLAFTIVGIEFTDDLPELSKLEAIALSTTGYVYMTLSFVILTISPLTTAILIRLFIVRPEPFPWIDPEEPSA